MTRKLVLALCSILISLACYEIAFKRNLNAHTRQTHEEEIYLYDSNKSEETSEKQRNKSLELVQNGIFWSDYAESLIPKGILFSS